MCLVTPQRPSRNNSPGQALQCVYFKDRSSPGAVIWYKLFMVDILHALAPLVLREKMSESTDMGAVVVVPSAQQLIL